MDWGDYSPILRSAFHHEKIAFSRKTNNEYIEINEPRLAVALSGTPAQAPKLISSAEDGFLEQCPTDIQLQPEQWEVLNTSFMQTLSEVTIFTSEEASGIVYRLGLILFRLCMIFTALRKVENGEMTETIFCTTEDLIRLS